jgi:hypothetical protein
MTWPDNLAPGSGGPVPSRVYAGLLGDGSTFAPDRDMAAELVAAEPDAAYWARANRAFLRRAVRFVVDEGARQILDIGCGLPATPGSVHEAAWAVAPDTRVAYVDIDPVAVASGRQLLEDDQRVVAVLGDLRDPEGIVGHPDVASLLDWGQPIAIVLGAVLHFVAERDDPVSILDRLREAVAPGSHLILSHASVPAGMTAEQVRVVRRYTETTAPLALRTREQVEHLFAGSGWELIGAGLCGVAFWRPDEGDVDDLDRASRIPGWAGVAVKR